MDLQFLRTATRREHEATEAAMPLLGPELTPAAYAAVLRTLLFVVGGWEDWSARHAPDDLLPLLAARRRSPLLRADLDYLSRSGQVTSLVAGEVPRPASGFAAWESVVLAPGESLQASTPEVREAGFLGALYVVEGSTLGGRFLAREVAQTLNLRPGLGNAYFEGHGERTGALWREVTAKIAAVPEEAAERLVGAARRTFGVFQTALAQPTALPGEFPARPAPEKLQSESVSAPARRSNEASNLA